MATWVRRITGIAPLMERMLDDATGFTKHRDDIVALFKADEAYNEGAEYGSGDQKFVEAVDELACAESESEFDGALQEIYDWADAHRVWIDPIG